MAVRSGRHHGSRSTDEHGMMTIMDAAQITAALDDVFDHAIVFHGFTDYMRDYDVFIYATADPRTGPRPEYLRYRFKYCVRATVDSAVPPDVWARSLDERLVDYETGRELDGYVWGTRWQCLYPGARLVGDSAEATAWSTRLGLPFHEARIETNGHNLTMVFSDLQVDAVEAGLAPFVVPDDGSAHT
ncbi:YxiG-like protein [Nocardia amikacinitolerans]